jgi:uncharacterized protein YbcI
VPEQEQRSPAVAISNAVVQIHKEGYGKGATRARTRIVEDAVVVELEDVFTRVEHTLIAAGRQDQIRETRQIFQQSQRQVFISAVEEITGRKVRALFSQVHFDPDLALEVFLLEPETID